MTWTLTIENVAGIRDAEVTVQPSVNAVRASNWQGKSSLLAAIRAVMGVSKPLSEGAESGFVSLEMEDSSTSVHLYRENGRIDEEGTPYLSDEYDRIRGELFAFLDERNPIRQAVRSGNPLKNLLTRPLDFENIDEQIVDRKRKREQVENELERAEEAADKLPTLEERKTSIENDLQERRRQRDELPTADDDASGTRRDELSSARAERNRLEKRLERLKQTLERAREKRTDRQEELNELEVDPDVDLETDLAAERQELRDREREIELLQSVYESNRRILDEDSLDLLTNVSHELLGDAATCWVCGQDATREDFEAQLNALSEQIGTLQSDATEHREQVEVLEERHKEHRRAERRQSELESEVQTLKETVSEHEDSVARTTDQLEELTNRVETLEENIEQIDDERANIESDIRYLETEIEDVQEEIERTEAEAKHRETLKKEQNQLTDEIIQLRTRKEETKQRIRDEFEAEISEIIPQFEVGFETARLTSDFELIIAREGREASLDALSEGEVELLGIIVALAGYEAFEVADAIPILTLDQLGSIATDNLEMVVEYMSGRAKYLLLTAFPEDTSFNGHEIDPAPWSVISDDLTTEAASQS